MYCPKCGCELPYKATMCTSCGYKTEEWKKQVNDGKNEHSMIFFIFGISIFLIIAGFLVLL